MVTSRMDADSGRLTIISILGQRISLSREAVASLYREPFFQQFFTVGAVIVILGAGGEYISAMRQELPLAHWIACQFLVFLAIWVYLFLVIRAVTWLMDRGAIKTLFLPIVTIPIGFLIFFANGMIAHFVIDDLATLPIWTSHRVLHVLMLLCLDFMFVRFICPQLPLVLAERAEREKEARNEDVQIKAMGFYDNTRPPVLAANATDQRETSTRDTDYVVAPTVPGALSSPEGPKMGGPQTSVNIGGQMIQMDQLNLIRSEDHYLRCYLQTGELLLRATMRSVVAEIDPSLGIQVNRSTWVPFHFVRHVEQRDSWTVLILANGKSEKIANSRRIAVVTALEAYRQKNP